MKSHTIDPPTTKSVLLQMLFNGVSAAIGTGFIVSTRDLGLHLVTARHNFTGRDHNTKECLSRNGIVPNKVTIFHHSNAGLGRWTEVEQNLLDENGLPLWIEHPYGKDRYDICALKLKTSPEMLLDAIEWRARDTLHYQINRSYFPMAHHPSSAVSIIGFPFGMVSFGRFPIWLTGHIASEPALDYENHPCFLVDCRTRSGCSGSPVICYSKGGFRAADGGWFTADDGGDALLPLGIYTGRIRDDSDIGIVWKWNTIYEIFNPNSCVELSNVTTKIR